jgi:hypothetical protein
MPNINIDPDRTYSRALLHLEHAEAALATNNLEHINKGFLSAQAARIISEIVLENIDDSRSREADRFQEVYRKAGAVLRSMIDTYVLAYKVGSPAQPHPTNPAKAPRKLIVRHVTKQKKKAKVFLTDEQGYEVLTMLEAGDKPSDVADLYGVHVSTIFGIKAMQGRWAVLSRGKK